MVHTLNNLEKHGMFSQIATLHPDGDVDDVEHLQTG